MDKTVLEVLLVEDVVNVDVELPAGGSRGVTDARSDGSGNPSSAPVSTSDFCPSSGTAPRLSRRPDPFLENLLPFGRRVDLDFLLVPGLMSFPSQSYSSSLEVSVPSSFFSRGGQVR